MDPHSQDDDEDEEEKQLCLKALGNSFSKDSLKKWKSLEGDWKTFRDGSKEADGPDSPSSGQTPQLSSPTGFIDGEYAQDWTSLSPTLSEDRHEEEESGLSDVNESRLSDVHESGLSDFHGSRLSDVHESGLSDVHESRLSDVHVSRLSDVHECRLSDVHEGRLSDVHESRLSDVHESRLSDVHGSAENIGIIRRSIDNLVWDRAVADNQSFNEERNYEAFPNIVRCSHEDNSKFKSEYGPLFEDVVSSSYPLLKENISLLEKFKKERDVCRQLESDMRNLEGQIQDVSKSFELEIGGRESDNESDGDNSFELGPDSPQLSNSRHHIFANEELIEEIYEEEETGRREVRTDPALVVEDAFTRLLLLADRLENVVRTSDIDFIQLQRDAPLPLHTSPREWDCLKRCHTLARISAELRCVLNELQIALRELLVSKGWCNAREHGDTDCSSPASFTFHGFLNSQVIVPTVRAIFTQVGDSIELRPIENDSNDQISLEDVELPNDLENVPRSPSTLSTSPKASTSPQNKQFDNYLFENYDLASQNVYDTDVLPKGNGDQIESSNSCLQEEESEVLENLCKENLDTQTTERLPESTGPHSRSFSEILFTTNYDHSSEIIKRIERLQELVRPELCESLKQRALRIHRAKAEFLSGVPSPAPIDQLPETTPSPTQLRPASSPALEILIQEIPSLPNGLIVKSQEELPNEEEKRERIVFPFLKKKWKDWSQDKLSTESLILDDKSDWLRNPFRPKGKYKISK